MKKNKKSEIVPGDNARVEELGPGCFAYSADGCSNTGFIVGDRGVLVIDGQGTPSLAEKVLEKIREKTDKPIKQVVLTHYHADSGFGAQAFEGHEIIASDLTRRMMDTRGRDDLQLSIDRYPDIYPASTSTRSMPLPTMTIASSMTIDLGNQEVRLMHLGRGHTMGDLVVWVPGAGVIYAGDLVQAKASPYCGDAHLADWPRALDRIGAFRPTALMPGRGKSVQGASAVAAAIDTTRDYIIALRDAAAACVEGNLSLKDTFASVRDVLEPQFSSKADFESHLKFNIARAYDEALGLDQPQMWSRERVADLEDALNGVVRAEVAAAGPLHETYEQEVASAGGGEVDVVLDETSAEDALADDGTSEQSVSDPEIDAGSDTAAETDPGADVVDLVSDTDFAASLLATPEDGAAFDEDALDLSESAVVETKEDTGAIEGDSSQSETAEEGEKVLEQVGV